MSLDFFRTEWVDWTFWRGSSWNDFILNCADTTEGQYCCFVVWTLDRSPSSIPAVNSIWEILHRLAVFLKYDLFHGWLSFPEETEPNGVPKVQKTHLLLSPRVFYPSHYFTSLSSTKGRFLFALFLSLRERNTLSALTLLTWIYWHFCVCII